MRRPITLLTLALPLALAACSADAPDTASSLAAPDSPAPSGTAAGFTLPDDFPEQIPLPETYLIVRNSTGTSELSGREIALNVALPGTIEEWKRTYDAALREGFEAVEFDENISGLRWRFRGRGFEYAILYLNDNQGYLDRGSTDSTHLPVMLSLQLTERRSR
ncbi:hypothetical protein [Wenzhouxiangella sediminis]|uniref:hypothetical protein n=1 Tax=Wenzhouxiangella sediminis TaxID=1792836 RepID=UPI0011C033A4|nr:hypothetical protein [Wenzhouxiangella sediminis]